MRPCAQFCTDIIADTLRCLIEPPRIFVTHSQRMGSDVVGDAQFVRVYFFVVFGA
jgi:hypothetical protein